MYNNLKKIINNFYYNVLSYYFFNSVYQNNTIRIGKIYITPFNSNMKNPIILYKWR